MSYEDRMQTMGLAPKEDLQNLLRQTTTFMSTALDAPLPTDTATDNTPTPTSPPSSHDEETPIVAIVLDVRSLGEIKATGMFHHVTPTAAPEEPAAPPAVTPRGGRRHEWVHIPVMPEDTEELVKVSSTVFPNKDLPIVVYCKSGNRAGFAKRALESLGYTHVLNAGGYDDIMTLDLS